MKRVRPWVVLLVGAGLGCLLRTGVQAEPSVGGDHTARWALSAAAGPSVTGGFDLQHFVPAASPRGGLLVPTAELANHLQFSGGLVLHHASQPLVLEERATGEVYRSLVRDRFQADLVLALGLLERYEFTLVFPTTLYQHGLALPGRAALAATGPGDLRLGARWLALRLAHSSLLLGTGLEVTLPTGDETSFLGEGTLTWSPSLHVSYRWSWRVQVRGQLGVRFREPREWLGLPLDHELIARLGAELPLTIHSLLLAELSGLVPCSGGAPPPTELLLGARFPLWRGLQLTVGGGLGLLRGYGVPQSRLLLGLTWASPEADRDGDRVVDRNDRCPDQSEDLDRFEDEDGCPDPDNDRDGQPDATDRCPAVPEDRDGFEDQDGCPEPDNDQDRVPDERDACPAAPEDLDGWQDEDGCPDPDDDGDRLCDPWVIEQGLAVRYAGTCTGRDQCPRDAEDPDRFQDEDGCPDPDNDQDRLCDPWVQEQGQAHRYPCRGFDQCPDEPERYDQVGDADGCPDQPSRVRLAAGRLALTEAIDFHDSQDTLRSSAHVLLDEVVRLLQAHPELFIRIEGHTDGVGDARRNLELSQARATAVMRYLIRGGIDPTRLVAQGFGGDRPVATNTTADGRARNRRIEFVLLEEE